MMFTNLEMWLLGWVILITVLGNLALVFSLFKKTEKISEKLIFITMAITIPLLMVFWTLNEIFKKIDSRKAKKRKDLFKKMSKRSWVDAFAYSESLDKGPDWIEDAFRKGQIYYMGPDLIVKTSEGDVLVKYQDRILKYADNTLGVMPKDLTKEVSSHE